MKLFSKVIALSSLLSLLLVVPTFTRDHNHCCQSKAVGSYVATIGDFDMGVVVLHEDGTMMYSGFIDETQISAATVFTGKWKCINKSCIEFCATSILFTKEPLNIQNLQVSGSACFNAEGKLCGNNFTYRSFKDGKCIEKVGPYTFCFTPQECNLTNSCVQ